MIRLATSDSPQRCALLRAPARPGLAISGLVAGALAAGGCQRLECAEGTFELGDTCVGYDPSDATPPVTTVSPAGGRTRTPVPRIVTLTTDEPARIFYTIDGSEPSAEGPGEVSPVAVVGIEQNTTLKYFAIDRAGNREPVVSLTFDYDVTPPAQPSGFTLAMTGADATLQWTNPADPDYAGTVIARISDVIDVPPAPGQIYTTATALSPSVQILAVGKLTQLTDPARPPGPVRYAAWTYDDLGNYSAPVAVADALPIGSVVARLSYNAANDTLTRVEDPANLALEGTTAALAGDTLTLTLKLQNNTARYFQNLKAEVTSVTGATFTPDGTADGLPFRALGPEILAPKGTVTRALTFTGVAAGSTVTIDLTFADHASVFTTAGRFNQHQAVVDLGAGVAHPVIVTSSRGPSDRANGRIRPGRFIGGHYLDIPTTQGTIERWDLVTRTQARSVRLVEDGVRANVQGLYTLGTTTYAILKYGGRRRVGTAELVRLDEGLNVTGRLDLLQQDGQGFGRAAFSADGSTLAIPVLGGVVLVDLPKLALIDATPSTPSTTDLVEPGFIEPIRAVHFFDNARGLLILARHGGRAAVVRRTDTDYTVTPYQDADASAKGFGLAAASDGKIWMAFASSIRAFDPATGAISTITYPSTPQGLAVVDGAMWILRADRVSIDRVSTTGTVQRTITLTPTAATGAWGHWLETAR